MNKELMFSSKTDMWPTPQKFFDEQNKIHSFTLDCCASKDNAKCDKFFTEEDNGLQQTWTGNVWMNPPYGRGIGEWVKKAYESVFVEGSSDKVVCLLPARTDTKWFHNWCVKGKVEFIKGRLKFGDAKNSAPFPSMLVVFEKETKE